MSGESFDEPTASFTPIWEPVWDDEPSPVALARPPKSEPDPAPWVAARRDVESPREDERRNENERGRTWRALARLRALIGLMVVVVFSGVALAAAVGFTALAIGLALRQVAGS